MGETALTQLCRVECDASMAYDEVLMRACSILDADGTIPDALSSMHNYRLCDANGVSLEDQMFIGPGATVHLHSRKGEDAIDRRQVRRKAEPEEEATSGCYVMYGEDLILEIPVSYVSLSAMAIRDWTCETLGLMALKHYAFRNDDGHYVLQEHALGRPVSPMRSTSPALEPEVEAPTPMLVSDDVWSVSPIGGPYVRVRRADGAAMVEWRITCGPTGLSDHELRCHLAEKLDVESGSFVLHMEYFPMTKPWWSPGDLAVFVNKN